MDEKKLVSTELNEKKAAAFKNGDDAAKDKNLTNPIVAQFALKAVFLLIRPQEVSSRRIFDSGVLEEALDALG